MYDKPKVTIDLEEYNAMQNDLKVLRAGKDTFEVEALKTVVAELLNSTNEFGPFRGGDYQEQITRRLSRHPFSLGVNNSKLHGELTGVDIIIIKKDDKQPRV